MFSLTRADFRPRTGPQSARLTAGPFARAALALLLAAPAALGQDAPQQPEEAAEFARRAASAALHGPQKIFLESIDADGVLRRILGNPVWAGLTPRQRAILRSAVQDQFAQTLAPAARSASDVAWAFVPAVSGDPIFVDLGLRYDNALLKTRWSVQRSPRGWAIEDILLVDPGISLADEVRRMLGAAPVRPRDTAREARARALPRLAGLAAILVLVGIFARRLPRERRLLLWLTASVPAALFLIDGALAVRRTLAEPYALAEAPPPQPWRKLEAQALEAQRSGADAQARELWGKAIEAGALPGPVYYQMGLAARARGETEQARLDFQRALGQKPPAPGAGKELAMIALAQGKSGEARALLEDYLRQAGPDPESLSTLAVAASNGGDSAAAAQAIQTARSLVPEGWKRTELEAQVYARSGDAAAAIAALRTLEPEGRLDRLALRADPDYLPIATDPAWVAFLAEVTAEQ